MKHTLTLLPFLSGKIKNVYFNNCFITMDINIVTYDDILLYTPSLIASNYILCNCSINYRIQTFNYVVKHKVKSKWSSKVKRPDHNHPFGGL